MDQCHRSFALAYRVADVCIEMRSPRLKFHCTETGGIGNGKEVLRLCKEAKNSNAGSVVEMIPIMGEAELGSHGKHLRVVE